MQRISLKYHRVCIVQVLIQPPPYPQHPGVGCPVAHWRKGGKGHLMHPHIPDLGTRNAATLVSQVYSYGRAFLPR